MVDGKGGSPVGSWEGMADPGLPCPSYSVRVDALGVSTEVLREGAVCFL